MSHPPPATASHEADLGGHHSAMVEAAIANYHEKIAPDPCEWTFEMRREIARHLEATAAYRAPTASADEYVDAKSADLNTIAEIAWFADLEYVEVARMHEERLAQTGELAREHETSERCRVRSSQRVRLAFALHYRRRRFYGHQRLVMHTRPRRRGAGRPRAQATRSSARSGDGPDDDGPGEPPVAPHRLAASRAVLVGGER